MARSVVKTAAFAIAFALSSMLAPERAWAIPEDHSQEIEWHAKQIEQLIPLTSAASCADACRALASMRRSVEKVCTLEPGGERCKQARAKESAAVERVRAACPECESAMIAPVPTPTPGTTPSPNATTMPGTVPPPPAPPRDQSAAGAQKSEETVVNSESTHKTGGCAGCSVASGPSPAGALAIAVVVAGALTRRRSRRKRS
jgi:MYXO-CTERM domain-containing protein